MAQLGNKQNYILNREWGKHVGKKFKRWTAKMRRKISKKVTHEDLVK